ncbi:MAG: hypothetical protein ABJK25_19175, partial [Halieaceae bacterium]
GPSGADGADGATGPAGAAGPTGPTGADSTVPGPTGMTGPQGDTGPQGIQGDTGPQGPQGNAGPQGLQGDTGPQGERGPTGPTGGGGSSAWFALDDGTSPDDPNEAIFRTSQVLIGASATAGGNAPLEVSSTVSGIIMPRLPAGNVASPTAGMMIYDTEVKAIKFFNGTDWISLTSNAGQVKIDGYNTGGDTTTKPNYTLDGNLSGGAIQYQKISYDSASSGDLVFSSGSTSWPQNVVTPDDEDFYNFDDDTFLENPILRQAHIWRVVVNFVKSTSGNKTAAISIQISNPSATSTFAVSQLQSVSPAIGQGTLVYNIISIADEASVPGLPTSDPGAVGYEFGIGADVDLVVTIDSITRISLQK